MRARIAQCLCPQRHAILGLAFDDDRLLVPDAEALAMLQMAVGLLLEGRGDELPGCELRRMNPWCGLCGAKSVEWLYELHTTKPFTNWEEAVEALKTLECRQQVTNRICHMLGISYDAKRQREMN